MGKLENVVIVLVGFYFNLVAGAGAYERKLPAIFIFGDSAIDIGTNNHLALSSAKANFPYNGIDFPHSKPTGRFSNGYNIGDQLAMMFGFKKSPPAYLDLINNPSIDLKKKVQRGVNFASAGSGIFYNTGFNTWNEVVPMTKQIEQFGEVISNIKVARGPNATEKVVAKALHIFCIGSNDFFDYMRAKNNTPKELYQSSVQYAYFDHLKNVYNMGGRKFAVMGVPPIGCCPYSRAINQRQGGGDACMPMLNDFAKDFYNSTLMLLQNMTSLLPNFKYSLGNVYDMTMDMLNDYHSYGFNETKYACCGLGNYNGENGCFDKINSNLCNNRSDHLFWDLYHPTQAASQLLASTLFSGDNKYMTPFNFSQLALSKVHI
ncbi:GDSL esterase/lipase At5g55050-like [Euphorbia lathyris]|uniref:GDSL esterase/lipase At5g55050-like n=1 Tax=Euphorbia lathyris TaxID=212925 RepID=UPI003313DAEC